MPAALLLRPVPPFLLSKRLQTSGFFRPPAGNIFGRPSLGRPRILYFPPSVKTTGKIFQFFFDNPTKSV